MIISLNKQSITIPGEHGEAPQILKNGEICQFDDKVQDGDHIVVVKGKDGGQPIVQLKDLLDGSPQKTVKINGQPFTIYAQITVNGVSAILDQSISDRNQIVCKFPETIEAMLGLLQLQTELAYLRPFHVIIDGKQTFIPELSGKLYRNGLESKPSSSYEHLDEITIVKKKQPTAKDLAAIKHLILSQSIPVSFNGKKIMIKKKVF